MPLKGGETDYPKVLVYLGAVVDKLKRSPEALEQYNALFNEMKEKALTMKRGLSDDSPVSEVRAFSAQFIEWEQALRDLAEQLHGDME